MFKKLYQKVIKLLHPDGYDKRIAIKKFQLPTGMEETFFIDDAPANCQTAQSLGISTYTPEAGEDWGHLFK
jgi:FMN phosphatase YigB (HAD superfamily)